MGPFVQVVLGQIISLFGNAALRFVLPLILLRQTGSAAVYGAATALALLPALAGTLAGGVLADRCRKARLMVVLDLAAAGLALGAAASADNLPTVLWAPAALCALYALQGLYQPVVRASLPLLRTGDRLVQGNAVIQLVDTLDELLGPLLGSVLLGVMGLRPLLVLCGACFAASALLEWQIRIPGDRPQPRTQGKPDFAADLRESLTYLYHSRPELLRLAGIMALVNLVEIPAVVVGIPVVIVQYLGQSDAVLGAVQAVLSVGGLAGGALAGRSRHPLSDRQALGLLLGIAGLCAAMGVVLWVPPLACGGVALCGFGVMAAAMRFNVWFFARLQAVLPQAQLGRVTGCTMALASLTQPVGQAVYGVLFDVFSACPAGVLLGAGALSAVFLTGAMRHTFVRSGTRSSAKATAPDTRGAAIEVPLFTTYSFLLLPGAQEMRRFPGATRSGLQTQSRVGPHPEIPLLGSSRSPAPTVITFLLLPGAVILPGAGPRFPAAVTTVIPSSQARSTACTSRSSTVFSCSVVPTEIFKMRILSLIRSLHTQSIAARISCFLPFPLRSRIFTTTNRHPGAAPWYFPPDALPLPPRIPQTCVPCPLSS